ncbi:ras GEF [Nadsonia fulvescens var. elongata DSM 6958]|uniref:Ras GEF n=1 Tax=Nadsonia fulvescens var. elongata DSM 6958 TaxID=857566 RepID=A0A1E3PNY6_9ASCO|nr:ras GEF [Nadsonia fulvescens var. elongata DSM 6958]
MPSTSPTNENTALNEESFDFSDETSHVRTSSLANLKKQQLSSSHFRTDSQRSARNSSPSRQSSYSVKPILTTAQSPSLSYPRRLSDTSSLLIQRDLGEKADNYNNLLYSIASPGAPLHRTDKPRSQTQSQSRRRSWLKDATSQKKNSIHSIVTLSNYVLSDTFDSGEKDSLLSVSSQFPFLTALHSFQASSLSNSLKRYSSSMGQHENKNEYEYEEDEEDEYDDPTSTCLSFQKNDTVILHSLDPSGWGDATILLTGQRGWIPTNYFEIINHDSLNHLMSSILRFVIVPKSQPINYRGEDPDDKEKTKVNITTNGHDGIEYTFSQRAISSIISGVRSFLKSCGALTREPMLVQVSKPTRKYRKALLAELAILVSLTKQNKDSPDNRVIEKLVLRVYKILARAVYFLAVITTEKKRLGFSTEELDEKIPEISHDSRSSGAKPIINSQVTSHSTDNPNSARVSTLYHTTPPFAKARLLEINETMIAYLSSFISKIPLLNSDIENRSEVLHSTRLCVQASRELIAVIESIMFKGRENENASLDLAKDNLYTETMSLISVVREIVPKLSSSSNISASTSSSSLYSRSSSENESSSGSSVSTSRKESSQELDKFKEQIQSYKTLELRHIRSDLAPPSESLSADLDRIKIIASECMDTTIDCVMKCERVLTITGDFQLEATRLYPIFINRKSDNPIDLTTESENDDLDKHQEENRKIPFNFAHSESNNSNFFEGNGEFDISLATINELNFDKTSRTDKLPETTNYDREMSLPKDSARKASKTIDHSSQKLSVDTFPDNINGGDIPKLNRSLNKTSLDDRIIMDSNGAIHGASLEGLIKLLTDSSKSTDSFFTSVFFLSFHQFTTPVEFTTLLIDRFNNVRRKESTDQREDIRGFYLKQRILIYNVFKRWLESHWNPYEDLLVLETIKTFCVCELRQELPNASAAFLNLIDKIERSTNEFLRTDESTTKDLANVVTYKQMVVRNITKPLAPSFDISKSIKPADISRNQLNLLHRALVSSASISQPTESGSNNNGRETIFAGQSSKFSSSTTFAPTASIENPSDTIYDSRNSSHTIKDDNGNASFNETSEEDQPITTSTSASLGNNWGNSFRYAASSAFSSSTSLVTNSGLHGSSIPLTILDFEAKEIARQITLMDSTLFCGIQPTELLNTNFSIKKRHLKLAINVNAMTTFSNQIGAFVGDSILNRDIVSTKLRRNYLKQWIKIGHECLELHNLNGAFTILAALQSVTIIRLRKTWEMLTAKHLQLFKQLKQLFEADKNFSNYRQYLAKVKRPPCIPYLGIHLTDLTFIEEGNPLMRPYYSQGFTSSQREGSENISTDLTSPDMADLTEAPPSIQVINFDKYCRTVRIIGQIQRYQVDYSVMLTPVMELQLWLKAEMKKSHGLVGKDLNGLWRRSCLLEPSLVQNNISNSNNFK